MECGASGPQAQATPWKRTMLWQEGTLDTEHEEGMWGTRERRQEEGTSHTLGTQDTHHLSEAVDTLASRVEGKKASPASWEP